MGAVERRIESATKQAVRQRNYRRQRDRALARLANLYPNLYKELLEEERAKDEAQGKVWLDISGRTNAGVDKTSSNRNSKAPKRSRYRIKARNLGRKK
jgi:hypothetical protein